MNAIAVGAHGLEADVRRAGLGVCDPVDDGAPTLFVVPAFNEVENLPRLFADLEARPELFAEGSRLIVVDDGSSDGTAELAERYDGPLPVAVVRLGHNQADIMAV